MRRYQSHKQVDAAKIVGTDTGGPENTTVVLTLEGDERVEVTHEWLTKRVPAGTPCTGGYFVRYDDGYESWSPAEAFEAGYTLIGS